MGLCAAGQKANVTVMKLHTDNLEGLGSLVYYQSSCEINAERCTRFSPLSSEARMACISFATDFNNTIILCDG